MPGFAMPDRDRVRPVHLILFCLNLAFASSCGILACALTSLTYNEKGNGWWSLLYCFWRGAVRINRFLHLTSSNSLFGRLPNPGSQVGVELMYSISAISLAACFWLVCRFLIGARRSAVLLNPVAGIVALLGLPSLSVLPYSRFWLWEIPHSLWTIIVAEFVCIGILFLVYGRHPLSIRVIIFLFFLHYAFWLLALRNRMFMVPYYDLIFSPALFWFASIASAAAWLLYLMGSPDGPVQEARRTTYSEHWRIILAFALLFLAAMLWLPGRGYALTRAKDPQSFTLQMWQSGCPGRCPVYRIIIHGNGAAEYAGSQYVRERGPERVVLTQQQVQTILVGFDRADFFALEDSAFAWGFHTSRVRLKIEVDGKSKEVSSDMDHTGAKNGAQALFVEAVRQVDEIVGTKQWVECPGGRCSQ